MQPGQTPIPPYAIVPPVPLDPLPPPTNAPVPAEPTSARVVLGAFRTTGDLDRALARLAALRPPAIVMVEACDAAAARAVHGLFVHAPRTLIVAFQGAMPDVALGYRQAWQAIEGAGGVPEGGERGFSGAAATSPAGDERIVHIALPSDALTALLDWAAELGEAGGARGARVWPGMGEGVIVLAAGETADVGLPWLRRQVGGRGGRMAVTAAAVADS